MGALTVVGLVAAAVFAATPAPVPPVESVTVSPGTAAPGAPVDVQGRGFLCTGVDIVLLDPGSTSGTTIGTDVPDSAGEFTTKGVLIPAGAVPGDHEVEVTCPDDIAYEARTSFRVAAPDPDPVPRIVLPPGPARPGGTVSIAGGGFDACTRSRAPADGAPPPVVVSLDGATVLEVGLVESGPAVGTFGGFFTVASATEPGTYSVTATCPGTRRAGPVTASADLVVGSGGTVTPGGTGPARPPVADSSGGADVGVVGGLIGLVAVAGLGALLVRRRPRPAPSGPGPQRLPDVRARSGGIRSGPVVVGNTGPGRDVAVRVVAGTGPR